MTEDLLWAQGPVLLAGVQTPSEKGKEELTVQTGKTKTWFP